MNRLVSKKFKPNLLLVLLFSVVLLVSACSQKEPQIKETTGEHITTQTENNKPTNENQTTEAGEINTSHDDSSSTTESVSSNDSTTNKENPETNESTTASSENTTTKPSVCNHTYGEWVTTKAATCSSAGLKERTCTNCSNKQTEAIATLPHTEVTDSAVAATCTTAGKTAGKHCSVCSKVIVKQETIAAKGHTEVIIKGNAPTGTASGLSNGKKCSSCQTILVKQVEIAPYLESASSNHYYLDLAKQSNGAALKTLYDRIDIEAVAFHQSSTLNATSDGGALVAFKVNYSDLSLSENDVVRVWQSYKSDNPLFYWISNTVSFDGSNIIILVDELYAKGSDRTKYNNLVYDKLTEYYSLTADETSAYQIALAYHDAIIKAIDYVYEEDGITPEDACWAHNILGVFEKGAGVCESYARTFQILLNIRGVDSIFVTGVAGTDNKEDHAWNMVKLEDGNWYWCDLTWDDTGKWVSVYENGIRHNYFCVNDTQAVNWIDASPYDQPPATGFLIDHTIGDTMSGDLRNDIALPARSSKKFSSTDFEVLRNSFKLGKMTFVPIGYNAVQLTLVESSGELIIPATITYKGRTYLVTALGLQYVEGYLGEPGPIAPECTKITIPKTVEFIWDYALSGFKATEIVVDSNNQYFRSLNGVLFTKSLCTLIQYPMNAPKIDKYVIPDETLYTASNAFQGLKNPFNELVIGKNFKETGFANWGYGYFDKEPTGPFGGNVLGNDIAALYNELYFNGIKLKITISPDNPIFEIKNDILYEVYNTAEYGRRTWVVVVLNPNLTTVTLDEDTVFIDSYAFSCINNKYTNVIVGKKLEGIFPYTFCYNPANIQITYAGTMEEWKKLDIQFAWDNNPPNPIVKVVCTDGTINP